jgi:hypothetical protein
LVDRFEARRLPHILRKLRAARRSQLPAFQALDIEAQTERHFRKVN